MKTKINLYAASLFRKIGLFALVSMIAVGCTGEIDERYVTTFTGDMIYSYLKKDSTSYSEYLR